MDLRSRLQISWLGGSPIAGIKKEKEKTAKEEYSSESIIEVETKMTYQKP
jgi:hypothetical protein